MIMESNLRFDKTVKGGLVVKGHPDNIEVLVKDLPKYNIELVFVKISTNPLTIIEKNGGGQ